MYDGRYRFILNQSDFCIDTTLTLGNTFFVFGISLYFSLLHDYFSPKSIGLDLAALFFVSRQIKLSNVVPNFVERGFFYIKCRNQNDVRANAWLPFFRLYRTQALICVSVYFPSEQNNITYHQLRLHRAWWLFYYISMTHFKRDRVWYIYVKKREQVTCFPQRTHATPKPMEFYHANVSISLLFDVCGFLPPSRANVCEKNGNRQFLVMMMLMTMMMWTSFKMLESPWAWRREQITLNKIKRSTNDVLCGWCDCKREELLKSEIKHTTTHTLGVLNVFILFILLWNNASALQCDRQTTSESKCQANSSELYYG